MQGNIYILYKLQIIQNKIIYFIILDWCIYNDENDVNIESIFLPFA